MRMNKILQRGFTLIEVILVLAVVSFLFVMGLNFYQQKDYNARVDRTALQMQQLLGAAISYNVAFGSWPGNTTTAAQGITDLKTNGYLPNVTITSPWGQSYFVMPVTFAGGSQVIGVFTTINNAKSAALTAQSIAGRLPMAYTTSDTSVPPLTVTACAANATTCTVMATATVPVQSIGNSTALNFGGVYHNGACVPVPSCPVSQGGSALVPEILVSPVSVSGAFDSGSTTNLYPISSFTAFATGGTTNTPPNCATPGTAVGATCLANSGGTTLTGKFWRVCLQVISERGTVNWNVSAANNWGVTATLMAVTRCSITNEPAGSDFTVFTP